ncbi:MAG TPA: N-acetylmuramic acid 6-phosphate etherase [Ktedonobacteraceae bacterium]|jgi:N-acetylmuramic acid 6-phosphate etherase|nr:N-acetylmuramic acid 6-phosphate etherase [Ktedonobacteraceae bacterium]
MSNDTTSFPGNTAERPVTSLLTEQVNPATLEIDRLSPLELVKVINAEDAKVAQAVAEEAEAIAQAIELIASRLRQGGRLVYMGAGTSGRLGVLDALECPPTFNISPSQVIGWVAGGFEALATAQEDAEDSFAMGQADAAQLGSYGGLTAKDVLVGITASGRTPYTLGALTYARAQGTATIGIANNRPSPLEELADISIAALVGPEAITGSTRLKSGTAQKMVLNLLSTGSMILLGKTYGNLMVDVYATNYKLQRRAAKAVQLAAGVDQERAEALLQAAEGETKTAIVMARAQVSPEEARQLLTAHEQNLRQTLDALE